MNSLDALALVRRLVESGAPNLSDAVRLLAEACAREDRLDLHELVAGLQKHIGEDETAKELLVRKLKGAGGALTRRELSRKTQALTASRRAEALEELLESGTVALIVHETDGRPRHELRLVDASDDAGEAPA
ncbi:MAG: hypothetical protein AAGH15_05215 [Myxococcota bacterium]